MKEFDFFKELNKELDGVSLPMSEKLKNEPIKAVDGAESGSVPQTKKTTSEREPKKRKRWIAGAASGVAAVIVCSVVAVAAMGKGGAGGELGCMYVDINPSVAVLYGSDGRVEKVVSRNEDGDALLADQAFLKTLKGKKLDEAAVEISKRAAQTGYLDFVDQGSAESFSQVKLNFLYDGEAPAQATVLGVKNAVTEFFKKSGAFVYVDVATKAESGLKDTVASLQKQASYVEETLNLLQGDVQQSVSAVKSAFYGYATDLMENALGKYDLLAEMSAVNDEIKNAEGNFFKLDYWTADLTATDETVALGEKMQALTERAYYSYGDDYRLGTDGAALAFLVTESVCGNLSETAEEFRGALAAGLREDNFAETELLQFSGFASALGYSAELSTALQTTFGALVGAIFSPIEETVGSLLALQSQMAAESYGRFAEKFDEWAAEKEISDAEYEAFLARIGKAE
ncbi:MAG: hypothetical protein IJ317_02875 [Clostridia bacterium]|nr:hypothetical protein [Clostridia bacterium]